MAEQLEIVIGANVDDAKAGVASLTKTIDDFGKQGKLSIGVIEQSLVQLRATIKQTTNPADLQKLNLAFTALQQKLTQLKNEGGLAQNLGGISRSARLAHSDIDQLSRDLQLFASGNERAGDALSNLVFTFERLKGTAGGTRAAISALGSAFLGPAGIIIGVSTALNLLTPFIEKLFSSGQTAKKVKQDILNFGDAVARLGAEAAAQSVAPLEKYKVALTDLDVPMQQRLQALKDYNKESDKSNQLQQTDLSNIEKVNTAIGSQVELLERRALIKGAEEKLVELYKTIFENEFKIQNAVERTNIKFKDQADAFAALVNKGDAKKFTQDIFNLGKAANTLGGFDKLQNLTFPLEKAKEQVNNLLNFIDAEIKKGGVFKIDVAPEIKLTDAQRAIIEFAKFQSQFFDIPIPLRFQITDDSKVEFKKAQDIIKGIEDHTIRLKFISLTETKGIEAELKDIQVPKLKLEIDKADTKQQIADLAKGLTIPIITALDEPSLLQTEDSIKKVFSAFSDTNIFTEAGRNAGEKFRKALLDSVAQFNKGFTINPNIDVTDVISSLTTSLAGIKDIQLKVIKTETFDNAIRTLRDLHDAGVEAGDAVEKAMLKAGFSAQDAAKGAKAIADSYHGITKQTEEIAQALDNTLVPAFQDLFSAFVEGKNPVKAFFDSIIKGIEQVVAKLLATQLEKELLSLLTKAATTTAAAPPSPISAIGGAAGSAALTAQQAAAATSLTALTTSSGGAAVSTAALGTASGATAGAMAGLTGAVGAAIASLIAFSTALQIRAAFSLLPFGSFFAKGGDPAPDKPFIAGEKGWELIVPKTSMHVFTHEQSKSILSSSVNESETIREYLIATRVSQQVKEYFSTTFTERIKEGIRLSLVPIENRISETVKSINTNNDKLTAYTYRLHDSVTNNIQSLKESFVSSTESNKEINNRESLATITATISSTIEKLIPYARPSLDATIVKGDQSSHYENSFKEIERIVIKNFTTDSTEHSFRTASDKITSSFKELQSTSTKAIDRLHESVINNDVSTSINKLHEKISERSDKSVTIERIINNNFFSSDSFKETFKSMSLTDLQKTFHIPAFAQGGAVFGPTLAILGEGFGINRGNPEFVGTRSQLSGIQSGQFDVNVNVDGELSFSMGKLAIALNREQRSSFRTSGKPPF